MPPEELPPQPDHVPLTVRLFVGEVPRIVLDDGSSPRSMWVAVAMDVANDRAAGLGLYDALPSDGHLLALLDAALVEEGPLGTVWACACTAVVTDRALLWSTPETADWLSRRGIELRAAVPPWPAADERAERPFTRTLTSLCKHVRGRRHASDAERRALVTRQAAMEAAHAWRAACGPDAEA
jgi:hypothetical protein